tara:strand:+ start:2164 stop:2958 length:795 start_codon:yes stop_codon:yes gene_type:complete
MGLFSTLGGLAGALIPGLGPIIGPALGSGIGSLLDGDSPKKAIRNAVTAGVIGKFASPFLQKTSAGKAIAGAFGSAGIGTSQGIADLATQNAVTTSAAGAVANNGVAGLAAKAAKTEGSSLFSPFGLAATSIGLAAIKDQNAKDVSKPKYFSYHTGSPFDTMEEASAEDRRFEEKMGFSYPMGQMPQPTTPYAQGGFIEGPGTGTSDSVPAEIRQGGVPVQKALLSDGEFVMTEAAVTGAGNGDRKKGAANMYAMMRDFERGQA